MKRTGSRRLSLAARETVAQSDKPPTAQPNLVRTTRLRLRQAQPTTTCAVLPPNQNTPQQFQIRNVKAVLMEPGDSHCPKKLTG